VDAISQNELGQGEPGPAATHSNRRLRGFKRRLVRYSLFAIAGILLLGLIVPYIGVGSYGAQIQTALESALGRRVQVGRVHYTLFAGPGFSIDNVVIAEDPRYGMEPCAFVPTLRARVRLDKLLFGKIQIAGLRLVEPTLNLVKRGDGSWNAVDLIERLSHYNTQASGMVPPLEISDARLNFKFGARKTIFYIDSADLAVYPEASGKLRISFSGSPSRTDRSGAGFGTFNASINWYPHPSVSAPNQLEADLTLDRSNLSELTTLVEGYDIGIHGYVSSRLRLSGPATALKFRGDLRLEDVHRWDLTTSSGEDWNVPYDGLLDLAKHQIEWQTLPADPARPAPAILRVRINDFLGNDSWSIVTALNQAPAENLLPLARRMGLAFPPGLALKGAVNGAIGYSNRSGWNGGVALTGITASIPDLPTLTVPSTTLELSNDLIHFDPSIVEIPEGSKFQVSGDYTPSSQRLSVALAAENSPVNSLTRIISSWIDLPPVLDSLQQGDFSGQLRYVHEPAGQPIWSGQFQLTKGLIQPAGFALPLKQLSARVSASAQRIDVTRLNAFLGTSEVEGEYHYTAAPSVRERLRLRTTKADLTDIEQALRPTFGSQGFLDRFRFGRRSLPSWLSTRNLEGDLSIGDFSVAGVALGTLASHFAWHGPQIQLSSVRVQMPAGSISGRGSISLLERRPRFRLNGTVSDYPWSGGTLDASGQLETSGTDLDALANLQSSGTFEAINSSLTPEAAFDRLSGDYSLSFDSGWPHLRLTNLEAEQNNDSWTGRGLTQQDGQLVLDLENGPRQMHVVGPLLPTDRAESSAANP
jgi:AsmA protein